LIPKAFLAEISRNGFPFVGSAEGEVGTAMIAPSTGAAAVSGEAGDALVAPE
jgi:hypothetical protein